MKNNSLSLQGGEDLFFISSLMMKFANSEIESRIRDQYTNGEFVTRKEHDKIMRKLKLEKINNNAQ